MIQFDFGDGVEYEKIKVDSNIDKFEIDNVKTNSTLNKR